MRDYGIFNKITSNTYGIDVFVNNFETNQAILYLVLNNDMDSRLNSIILKLLDACNYLE